MYCLILLDAEAEKASASESHKPFVLSQDATWKEVGTHEKPPIGSSTIAEDIDTGLGALPALTLCLFPTALSVVRWEPKQ